MLESIKLLLNLKDNSKDELLILLIERAIDEFTTYTHNGSLENSESLLCQMVVYNYNRLATEGVNSENYSGISFNYSSEYPEPIMRQLRAKRKVTFK